MKTVWIINQYITSPEIDGDGYRHYYIGKYLKNHQYQSVLITSSFSHAPYRNTRFNGLYQFVNKGIPTLILKGNTYGSSSGVGRILSWFIFCFMLLLLPFIPKSKLPYPQVIVLSSLPLLPVLNVWLLRILYPKAKFVFEIRDLWPLSAVQIGGYSSSNPFIKFLAFLERTGYRIADYIVSVIPRADLHIEQVLGNRNFKFEWISNGHDINDVDLPPLDEIISTKFNSDIFKIGYAGTLVVANPLDTIIEVIGKHYSGRVEFYILGDGPEKERINGLCVNYDNIHLLGRAPRKYVHSFLTKMDTLFMGKGTKNSTIYKFGTSQLKTFDYFYAAKPIIQALCSDENPVKYAKAGYIVEPQNSQQLISVLDELLGKSEEELSKMGANGHNYLLEHCTYEKIAAKFAKVMDELNLNAES